MSTRIWIGSGTPGWADYSSEEYPDLRRLAHASVWNRPIKVYADHTLKLIEFLDISDACFGVGPEKYWQVGLALGKDFKQPMLEHPRWNEVEMYVGIKRPLRQIL